MEAHPVATVLQPTPASSPGLGDVGRLAAWEDTLVGRQLRDWKDLREALETAGPDMRTAAVSLCLEIDLQDGRQAHGQAHRARERFKADMIKRGGRAFADQIKSLDERLSEARDAMTAHLAVAAWAQRAAQRATDAAWVVSMARTSFRVVAGPWVNCAYGAEWGKGITGYDTPEGVAQSRAEHEQRMAGAARARETKRLQVQATTAPVVSAHVAEESRREQLVASSRAATAKVVEAEPVKIGALFGGGR